MELTPVAQGSAMRNTLCACNAAPWSNRLYTFEGTFLERVIELNAIIYPYVICRTQQVLMMLSQKSGFTSIGLWNILHLLAKIPKVHSTILRALDNLQLYICCKHIRYLLEYGRSTCSDKANASSPTNTDGIHNSSSLGRTLVSGIFSLLLSSNFPNVGF